MKAKGKTSQKKEKMPAFAARALRAMRRAARKVAAENERLGLPLIVVEKKRGKCRRLTPGITVNPEVLGGAPVFKGTRVPVKTLFEYIEENYTLDEFLECFPSVTREMACRVLKRSEAALLALFA